MNRSCFLIMVVVLSALLTASPALAEDVRIGGVTLTLGDSRTQTMAAAEGRLHVLPSRIDGYYNLYRKRPGRVGDRVQSVAIGALEFRNNRLLSVTRNLGAFQSFDGRAAIDNLIAAFAQALNEHGERAPRRGGNDVPVRLPPLTAKIENTETADSSISRLYFSFPDRVIQIAVFQPADAGKQASIAISEHYGLREAENGPPAGG